MSLARYRRERVIVQSPSRSAYDAARAMENNRIGAVVVQDSGRVVGIVTDRDLALRVIGYELNPTEARLREVMTPDPVTLSIHDSEERALELMRSRRVRRIPVMEGERVVGMVTLDDLVMSGSFEVATLSEVVRAQVAEPSGPKPAAAQAVKARAFEQRPAERQARHEAHAAQTLRDFAGHMQRQTGLESPERAIAAFEVVASGLMRRLTPAEASDFAAQLPFRVRQKLSDLPPGPDRDVTVVSISIRTAPPSS
jgi:CBS domain-containing protein